MSAEPIGRFPTEPAPGTPEAVQQAARTIETFAARGPKLRGYRLRAGYISQQRAAYLAGRIDERHGRSYRHLSPCFDVSYLEGRSDVWREQAEKARRAWGAGVERGRAAYAATATEGGA